MKYYNAGIIGLGVGEQHIAGYESHPQASVTALCDQDPSKRKMAKAKYPGIRVLSQADELIDDPEIDMISVASYDNDHFEQVMRSIEHGKSVFVEKPLCLYSREAKAIRRALCEHRECKISSNLILRKCPRFEKLRERIRKGELGQIFSIEGDYNYGRLHKLTQGWRGEIEFYSVTYGGGVHMIDLLLWLTGKRVQDVVAVGNRIAAKDSQFKYNDFVIALLRFENGMIGKVTANFGCVIPHFHRLAVFGTKSTFIHDIKDAYLYTSRDPVIEPAEVSEDYPGYNKGDFLKSFVHAVINGGEAEIKADEVFETMSVCFAIEKAVETGERTPVEYI